MKVTVIVEYDCSLSVRESIDLDKDPYDQTNPKTIGAVVGAARVCVDGCVDRLDELGLFP